MKNPDIEFDHVGIAVAGLDTAYPFWNALGWDKDENPETVKSQKVKVGMLPLKNQGNVELLEPTSDESPIKKFLEKRGPGLHHICFRVKNIDQLLSKLKDQGVKLINETPVSGAHNCRVAFVHPSSTGGVLVELSEKQI